MPRRHRRPLVRAVSWALCALLATAATAGASERPARSAGDFVDSLGVVTHAVYFDTAYADWDRVVARLGELGVRHVRDGLWANPGPRWADWNDRYYRAVRAAADAGVRFDFVVGRSGGPAGSLADQLGVLDGRLAGTADSLEAANEPDHAGRPAWVSETRHDQRALFRAVNADPRLRRLPVLGPSLAEDGSAAALGDLRSSLDAGNLHPYTGAEPPSTEHIAAEARSVAAVSGGKPLWATEVGFHNALGATSGQPPASERAAAVYTLRTFLTHFRAGVVRTFAYELLDEKPDPAGTDPEQHFGLLRHDFSPKPAFSSLAALVAAVRPQPGWSGRTKPLALAVKSPVADVEQLLLQRGDGSYALVLWRDISVWDPAARRERHRGTRRVSLGLPATARADVVAPLAGASPRPVRVLHGRVAVDVGAAPVVLQVHLG